MKTYEPGFEIVPGHRLVERLGGGSFGEVWKAEAPGGVFVAVKIISKLNGIHAIREWQSLQAVKNLRHGNLVSIFSVWLRDEAGRLLTEQEIIEFIPQEVAPGSEPKSTPPKSSGPKSSPDVKSTNRPSPFGGQGREPRSNASLSAATLGYVDEPLGTAPETQPVGSTDAASKKDSQKSASDAGSSGSGSNSMAKWSKFKDKVPPLELITVMTLGEGTLMDRLKHAQAAGEKGIPRDQLLRYMDDAAKGIEYLNKEDPAKKKEAIQHCDIKPENLLVVGDGVQVCDYGSALKGIYAADARTHQGYTEQYAAPEQLAGRRVKLHNSTDLYALAMSYYALRTGKYPWGDLATEPIPVIKQNERFDFSSLRALSKTNFEVEAIRKALYRDPAKRYATVTEFVDSLHDAVEAEEEELRTRRRRMVSRVLMSLAAIVLIAGGVYGYLHREEIQGLLQRRTPHEQLAKLIYDDGSLEALRQAIALANENSELQDSADKTAATFCDVLRGTDTAGSDAILEEMANLNPVYLSQSKLQQQLVAFTDHWSVLTDARKDRFARAYRAANHERLHRLKISKAVAQRELGLWLKKARQDFAEALDDRDSSPGDGLAEWYALYAEFPDKNDEVNAALDAALKERLAKVEEDLAANNLSGARAARRQAAGIAFAIGAISNKLPGSNPAFDQLQTQAKIAELCARRLLPDDGKQAELLAEALERRDAASARDQARLNLLVKKLSAGASIDWLDKTFLERLAAGQNALALPWERNLFDEAVANVFQQAETAEAAGKLAPEIRALLEPLPKSGGIKLLAARNVLVEAGAKYPWDPQKVASAKEKLNLPANPSPEDQLAGRALEAWLEFLTAENNSDVPLQNALSAFQKWADASTDASRANSWLRDFAAAIVEQSRGWNAQQLEQAQQAAATAKDRLPLLAMRLKERQLELLATDNALREQDYASIRSLCRELIAAAQQESTGQPLPHLLHPGVVDALYVESSLVPAVLSDPQLKPSDEIAPVVKRVQAAADSAFDEEEYPHQLDYLRFVTSLSSTLSAAPMLTWNASSKSPWLQPISRRHMAAYRLEVFAGALDDLPKGPQFEGALASYKGRSWLEQSYEWVKSSAVAGKLALCDYYDARPNDWAQLHERTSAALADEQLAARIDPREGYYHLLLIDAAYHLQSKANGADARAIASVAKLLSQPDVFDPLERSQSTEDAAPFSDSALFARALLPLMQGIDQNKAASATDVAVVSGAIGSLLERDNSHELAVAHFGFNRTTPEKVYDEMRVAYERAAESENDADRRIRWLIGSAFARDQRYELREKRNADFNSVDELEKLGKELQSLQKTIAVQSPNHFAVAMLGAMVDFYAIRVKNTFSDQSQEYDALIVKLGTALETLEARKDRGKPWCQSWKAAILQSRSIARLEKSWLLPWGEDKQHALLAAIDDARQATKIDERFRADPTRAPFALANAYEDAALDLKFKRLYERAADTLKEATKIRGLDAFRKYQCDEKLLRIKYRQLLEGPPSEAAAQRDDLLEEYTSMVEHLDNLEYRGAANEARRWQAQVQLRLFGGNSEKQYGAESIYRDLAKDAAGRAKADYLLAALDCAGLQETEQALKRAGEYLDQLDDLKDCVTQPHSWALIARMRAFVETENNMSDAMPTPYKEHRFKTFADEAARLIANPPKPMTKKTLEMKINLALELGNTQCVGNSQFETREAALKSALVSLRGDSKDLHEETALKYEILLDSRLARHYVEHAAVTSKAPLPTLDAKTATAQEKKAYADAQRGLRNDKVKQLSRNAIDSFMDAFRLSYNLQEQLPQLKYKDEQIELTSIGFEAAWERRGDICEIFDSGLNKHFTTAEKAVMRTWLEDASAKLANRDARTKESIDNTYLAELPIASK